MFGAVNTLFIAYRFNFIPLEDIRESWVQVGETLLLSSCRYHIVLNQ